MFTPYSEKPSTFLPTLRKKKKILVVQEVEGQALFGSAATTHSSRDFRDDPPLSVRTLQPTDSSSPAMEIADITSCGYKIIGWNIFPLPCKIGNSELCVILACTLPSIHGYNFKVVRQIVWQ